MTFNARCVACNEFTRSGETCRHCGRAPISPVLRDDYETNDLRGAELFERARGRAAS